MKIGVCLKQVPSRDWQPVLREDRRWVCDEGVDLELSEADGFALEAALRLRDKHGGEVLVCTAGPQNADAVIREALARGADRATRVRCQSFTAADPAAIARALATALRPEQCDLVLAGLQSDDLGHAQVGVLLAERLGIPHSTIVMDIDIDQSTIRVKRELESGWFQSIEMPMPALLTMQSGINQLRYATLKGIMSAKKKVITTITADEHEEPAVEIVGLSLPVKAKQTHMISGTPVDAARELVRRLREEAHAL